MKADFLELDKDEYPGFIETLRDKNEELNAFNFIQNSYGEGKIISVKDNICVKDMPATASSKILEGYKPGFDATVVRRLKENGFRVIGKTNMDEFGFGSFGLNSEKQAKNPFDEKYVSGGSSSGSAISTAIIKDHVSIAESTGGSISTPAAFCGVVGFTPTYGLVSRYGLIDYANSLDKIGFMGRNAAAIKKVFNFSLGKDAKDTTSLERELIDNNSRKLYVINGLMKGVNPLVVDRFNRLLDRLISLGYTVEYKDLEYLDYSVPTYYIISMAEASTNLAKYQGFKYGFRLKDFSLDYNDFFKSARKEFGKEAKRRVILGTFIRSQSVRSKYYDKALGIRHLIIRQMKKLLSDGLIISPTMPIFTPKIEEVNDINPVEAYSMDMLTIPPNLCGFPHVSFPYFYEKGMPMGAQLIADHFNDYSLFSVLSEWEQNFKYKFAGELG